MTFSEFMSLLSSPNSKIDDQILRALRLDASDQWTEAHQIIDPMTGQDAAWVHAYLHRKEGDIWNADYWYKRANRVRPSSSLKEEWESLVKYFTS